MSPFPLALEGIRVIDLSRVIAGPWCDAYLGDLRADVVKVEDIGGGDESRTWPPHKDGEATAYLLFNRNKRAMTLDLKTPEAVEVVKELVRGADVLVENFRTGTMESFGLGYSVLTDINPRLIYCSISAFGRTGPRKDSPGYDALMQAFGGLMSITGQPGGQPVRSGASFIDVSTGILSALGICSALLQRQRTGLGQRVDASLLDTAVTLLAYHAESYLLEGTVPGPLGSGHPSLSPYRNFRCAGGQWIFIAAANDRFWVNLVHALGRGDLAADPRFTTTQERVQHRAALETILEDIICRQKRDSLLALLDKANVPAAPVNNVAEVMNDAQTLASGIVQRVLHPKLSASPKSTWARPGACTKGTKTSFCRRRSLPTNSRTTVYLRRHHDVRRAVAPGALQLEQDLAFAIAAEPLVGDRQAGDVPAQAFEFLALMRAAAHSGTQAEAVPIDSQGCGGFLVPARHGAGSAPSVRRAAPARCDTCTRPLARA